ncbi:MAG: ABC transporter substrate-binding protein [Candidatus Bathyarchaeia archaeon]
MSSSTIKKGLTRLTSKEALTKVQAIIIALIIIVAAGIGIIVYYFVLPPSVEYKRTLVIAIPEEPEGLDIQQVSWSNEIHDLIFQSFMNFNATMGMVPDLATNVVMEGNNITIYLPVDAKFSNGDPITAEIMRDSIERYRQLSPYGSDYEAVIGYEIIDSHTLKIICNVPPVYIWFNDIPVIYGAVVNTNVSSKVGDAAFNQNPIGPGPYKVKEWVHGSYVLLERNDLYKTNLPFVQNKGPNPYIDEVMIRFIPEDLTRISELQAGTVDIVRGVPSDAVADLKTNPDVTLYESITPGIMYLMINVRRPPLDDVRVRKALIYAINRDEIKTTLEDTVLPCYSYMSPSMLAYNASVEEYASQIYAYNNETAKSLLAQAGWTDTNGDGIVDKDGQPLRLELLIPNDEPKFKRIGPLLQAKLASVGVDVDYKEYAYSYIRSKTREWDFDLAGRFYSWFDPAGILPYLLHSTIGNYTYSNPQVDSLFDEDRSTALSPAERTALYTEIQNILLEDAPWVPLYIDITYTAVRKNVEGLIVMPPFATLFIQDVKIKVVKGG